MTIETQSRTALKDLISLLQEVDDRWSGPEWNLNSAEDVAASHRALMHILEAGLVGFFEQDVRCPNFRRIVTPSRKLTGDNSDAIYFDAPVSADYTYVVHGTVQRSAYFSVTIEEGAEDGKLANKTGGVINDTELDIDSNGHFTIYLGGEPKTRNWLPLSANASRVTTRHYYEHKTPAAKRVDLEPRLTIECLSDIDTPEPANDASIAAGINRVSNFVRTRTLEMLPMANAETQPDFVGLIPNQFPTPVPPGDFGLAAFDAHYSMAPFFINHDEALVITGRWPECRFANICLWNRFQQTYDYVNRSASLNRAQTELEDDGSFKIILANKNPGHPNWIDTENNLFGLVFWRFFLVEGEVETPQATVVKLAELV
ncbi:DUF1214 domain-containing protein [Oceanicoccus sp. KOV_DT_Chl]|uniref:DUF1214 domain-containing protein n=1 Tax=Oceanicoccus sp. KOV_DT_Chl TaxID=1904639 RepID=UPI000C7BCB1A|nr:DUF1214 domain-containing protein [Oceanicoccus sp. KOV_DT_Chl]